MTKSNQTTWKRKLKRRYKKMRSRSQVMARRRRKQKKTISAVGVLKIAIIVFAVVLLLTRATALFKHEAIEIQLAAHNAEIYMDQELPVYTAEVSCEGDTTVVLDKETGYTIQHLIDELESGSGYTLTSTADPAVVGEYEIVPELTSAVATPLDTQWLELVKVNIVPGILTVKEHDEAYLAELEAYRNRPMVALTFDDGPGKHTMRLLEALEANDAQATFFLLGQNVPIYQEEVKKMYEIGCDLGNHTYNHPDLTKVSGASIAAQIGDTNKEIEAAAGVPASLVRPPYGAVNSTVRENAGMPLILWNVDTLDWQTRNTQAIIDHVLSNVQDGDIILMHDIYSTTVDAAIELITLLQDQGYSLVTVRELAESRGYELVNGEKYFNFENNI